MQIILSFHAEFRLQRRKLLREEVIEAIRYPDITIKRQGKYYYQKRISRGQIEVVCEKTEKGLNVITVYWL